MKGPHSAHGRELRPWWRRLHHRVRQRIDRLPGWMFPAATAVAVVGVSGGPSAIVFWFLAVISVGVAVGAGMMVGSFAGKVAILVMYPLVWADGRWPRRGFGGVASFVVAAAVLVAGGITTVRVFSSWMSVEGFEHLWVARTETRAAVVTLVGMGLVAAAGLLAATRTSESESEPSAGETSTRRDRPGTSRPDPTRAFRSSWPPMASLGLPSSAAVVPGGSQDYLRRVVHHTLTGNLLDADVGDRETDEEFWSPTPIEGWRAWTWNGTVLRGMRVPWPTPRLEATCLRGVHDAPDWDCRCGIYAVKDPWHVPRFRLGRDAVIGRVELSGMVIEHDEGYRAEVAVITHLWVLDPALQAAVQRAYPTVEVAVVGPPFGGTLGRR